MTTTIPKPGSIPFTDRVTKAKPYEWGYGSTPRTAKLRDELHWKAAVVKDWVNVAIGEGKCEFRKGVRIDLDRARLVTQAYKETEGQPPVIQKARSIEKLCDEMPIFIKSGELIVGDPNGTPDEVRWYPEISVYYMPDAVTRGSFSEMVTDEEKRELIEDIYEYWKDKAVEARVKATLPEELIPIVVGTTTSSAVFNVWEEGKGAPAYDYESLMKEGLKARIERVEAKLKELDSRIAELNPAEYTKKKNNWESMARSGRAILRFSQRYADLAREQARAESDATRRAELGEIATILDWVPANPPRTFHECLQFYWMIEVVGRFLAMSGTGCGVRIDQVWWPYYESDMKAGRIAREKALELVECLFLKVQEVGAAPEWPLCFVGTAGADIFYTPNICGTTPDGKDASNDVSCLVMEALANAHLNQPPVALRYHRNISPQVVDRAIDLLRVGMGHPSFFNEELLEKWGLLRGWSPEDTKNTQVAACVANHLKGKPVTGTSLAEVGGIIMPKILEEVLFKHDNPDEEGEISPPATKDPRDMKSAEEVLDAICERVLFRVKMGVVSWNIGQQVIMDYNPDACNSFLMDGPLERGIDLTELHKECDTWPNVLLFGAMNVADSLSAMQKLVFDDKKYTVDELLKALQANWAGYEEMRQDFLNAPKYGNDDDYADQWVVKLTVRLDETIGQVKDAWGYPVAIDGSTAAAFQMMGLASGATPDGRLAMTYLADGSRSPMSGVDKEGPTAVLNSVAKIPYVHTGLLNQRFMPQFLDEENRHLFAEYLREWYDKGTIPHVQFNVVDSSVLREAQEHPDNYRDLQVRVAGYSAFWVDLPNETQESIIARTEQCLG